MLHRSRVNSQLAKVKVERERERYSHKKAGDDRQPEVARAVAPSFSESQNPKSEGRDNYIECEEPADLIRK